MSNGTIELDELDRLANEAFPGLVVRKDLLRRMRSAFGVPAFVIEFLLGKYCASTDEEAIREGLEFVRETLSSKYVKPDEREAVKSAIKQHSTYEIIDKISVRLVETHDKYWARLANLDLDFINVEESQVREHDRLLMGGVWAEIKLRYDDAYVFKGQNRPFFVESIRPIQLSTRNIERFIEGRKRFTRDQWLDLLMRSMGYEPNHPYYTKRRKLHYLQRLIPLVERNYNSIELGPRGTGKSFVYQQLSPYCHLVSGGQTTTAQMFVNLSSGQRGLVALWDVVAFDEAAGIKFTDKNGLNIMKGYMEDGAFSRGGDVITAEGSVVFVGNIDGDIETIIRTSNLFYPMPKEMDTAFYDRIHAYIPGWEFQKTSDATYTNHFGLVTDYLAEVFREVRKRSYGDLAERYFRFGQHLGGRDQKAVRKTVSGLIKLLHPDGEVSKSEVEEYLAYAMEGRRRVKEQLKKMGGLEYWDTTFSYVDIESGQETFVPVAEMGSGSIIAEGGLPPGSIYTIGTDASDNRLAMFLLQTQMNRGSGRIVPLGNLSSKMKEAIKTADAYLKANLKNLGIDQDLKAYDFTVQAINLNQAKEGSETAVAFFLSMVSALLGKPILDRTVVLGEMSVQGMLLKVSALPERMQAAVEAGAKRILIPSENKRDLAEVPDAILTAIQWQFYDSPTRAAILAMGMG
ncbi:protease Lon-related BREX system protein BrxL [Myxococcus sp. MxC21-1]|uniref:protease Lon-related BREX system protein BrxL n=1 Tax=Myxococcus sp. MxC21-1 TaxID=3041439 RepID=UPI00292EEE33|nr:protease Lon-related BREX system protein BrxL [Myxococcus sp. MxC21-1]WNZ59537.1 protease Lon-related BREX system protein BrxL [Myxococcus sp. MxC21-1]